MKNESGGNWYENELKSREGKVILPSDFGSEKYKTNKMWLNGLKPSLFVKLDAAEGYDAYLAPSFAVTELLYAAFAQHLGADAVNVKPMDLVYANGTIKQGMLIENFVTNPETQVAISAETILHHLSKLRSKNSAITYMCENTLPNHLEALKEYVAVLQEKYHKPVIIDPNIEANLFRMILIDFVLLNKDRHTNNISYILEDCGDHLCLTLSKIYDNSLCLGIDDYNKYHRNASHRDMLHGIQNEYKPLRFLAEKPNSCFTRINEHAAMIAAYLAKNPQHYGLYQKATSFPFDNLKTLIHKQVPNYPINQDFFKFAKKVSNYMVKTLAKHVKKQSVAVQADKQGLSR